MAPRLHTIIGSTRPGCIGPSVATWFHAYAEQHALFKAVLVDLKTFDLPVFDEPFHPALQKYQHARTKKWAASVEAADAFVFVAPEYNYGPSPALLRWRPSGCSRSSGAGRRSCRSGPTEDCCYTGISPAGRRR